MQEVIDSKLCKQDVLDIIDTAKRRHAEDIKYVYSDWLRTIYNDNINMTNKIHMLEKELQSFKKKSEDCSIMGSLSAMNSIRNSMAEISAEIESIKNSDSFKFTDLVIGLINSGNIDRIPWPELPVY